MGLVTLLCGYSAQSSGHMLAKFVRVHIDIYTKRAISQSQIYLTFTSGVGQDEVTGCQSGVIFKHETNRFCGDHNCIIFFFFPQGIWTIPSQVCGDQHRVMGHCPPYNTRQEHTKLWRCKPAWDTF